MGILFSDAMTSDRPLNYNHTISPELIGWTVAQADERGRFWVEINAGADRSPHEWKRYEGRGGSWTDGDVAATAFDPVFRVILASMTACRLVGLTTAALNEPGAPKAWLARYATRDRRALDVDVTADGVGDDLDAWWWLVRHAHPIVSCDGTRLDAATLFTTVTGVTFMTTRLLSGAAGSHAKACAAKAGTVAFLPLPHHKGWQMVVVAARGLAGELGREAIHRSQLSTEVLRASSSLDVAILGAFQAGSFWTDSVVALDLEKYMVSALRRGEKRPDVSLDAIHALAAAEGVAIAEGRAAPTIAGGMAEHTTSQAVERVTKADPMSEATIELAVRVVRMIADDGSYERKRWVSDAAQRLFRAELEGLHKRLLAALAARRTRARAPNAVPVPSLRKEAVRPINWRTKLLHLLLDDAIAFIGAVRDGTGAIPMILMKDLTFHELGTDWEAREMVRSIRGCPFEERDGDWPGIGWPELRQGQRVLFWWPDVSPRPVARPALTDASLTIPSELHGMLGLNGAGKSTSADASWEIVSWGHAEILLRGATPGRVLRSEWSYPTGTELKQEKYAGPGPWKDVDWKMLRRKVKQVARLVTGALGGVAPLDLRDTWTLPAAAANARSGARVLMGDYFASVATLPR